MSYNPTAKTSYGDTDYSEDSWSPRGSASQDPLSPSAAIYGVSSPPPPPSTPYASTNPRSTVPAAAGMAQSPYSYGGQSMNSQYPVHQGQPAQATSPIMALANTITQEDILFMRSWQKDSFYRRVIPCEAVALGSMYMYNKTKGLPHSIAKYLTMSMAAFFFGKWTYRHEFKRRLAESPLNTPYMQALRRNLGLAPGTSSEFIADASSSPNSGFNQWTSGGQPVSYADDRQSGLEDLQATNYELPGSDRLDNQTNDDVAKPRVSYDELRARNRGFIK